jgi:uncharacterized protein YbjT (DUF2867 family)
VRILVLGASGLIGGAVSARLAADGHDVIGVSRHPPPAELAHISHISFDVARASTPESWFPLLLGIDGVVNCAGTLQDAPGESTQGVHHIGIAALFAACECASVRRVLHLSALGVDREATPFSKSKHQGEAVLMARELDWVILRPSVVIGRGAYGGSALIRGLAALPLHPIMPETGSLQLVWLEDLVETILFYLRPQAPGGVRAGTERHFDEPGTYISRLD